MADPISVSRPSQAETNATHGGAGFGRAGASGGSGGGSGERKSSDDTRRSVVAARCVFHEIVEPVASNRMTEVQVDHVARDEDRPSEAGPPAEVRAGRGVLVRVLPVVALVVLALTLYFRIAGPSNIYDKDQSKTIAYTVDMVRNGRWA